MKLHEAIEIVMSGAPGISPDEAVRSAVALMGPKVHVLTVVASSPVLPVTVTQPPKKKHKVRVGKGTSMRDAHLLLPELDPHGFETVSQVFDHLVRVENWKLPEVARLFKTTEYLVQQNLGNYDRRKAAAGWQRKARLRLVFGALEKQRVNPDLGKELGPA